MKKKAQKYQDSLQLLENTIYKEITLMNSCQQRRTTKLNQWDRPLQLIDTSNKHQHEII